jgi:hypothetical protein
MKMFFAALILSAVQVMAADVYDFSILPTSGAIEGLPGSTIGWGYSLHNESTSLWLVTTGVNTGVFAKSTPSLLFDFPDIAPGQTVTVPFNAASSSGLEEVTWDTSAQAGFTNVGNFILTAEWWTGDPLAGGSFQSSAPNGNQSYSAAVATPEPATLVLIALPLFAVGLLRRRRNPLQG